MPERHTGSRAKPPRPAIIGFDAKPDIAFARPAKYRPATPHLFVKKIHVYKNSFNFRENETATGLGSDAGVFLQQPSRIWMAADTPLSMPPRLFETDRPDTKKYTAAYPFGTGFDLPLERIHATLSVGMDKRRISERKESTESFDNLKISWSPNFTAALNKIRQYLAGFRHGSNTAAPARKIQQDLILAGIKVKY